MMSGRDQRIAGVAAVAALAVALGVGIGGASAAPGDSWLTARR